MFRFSIRDVLWLTVVVALAAGWLTDRTHLASELKLTRRYSWNYWWQLKGANFTPYDETKAAAKPNP